MIAAADLRLPGILVEAPRAALRDELPRMDVALFVGFAASGPIGVPVAIEQAAEFEAIFGPDVDLAWDLERGRTVQGELGPAVRSFFRNGGRRCWIVRVAGKTQSNRFPLSRLACWTNTPATPWMPAPAVARARSGGSWSDHLEVATEMELDALSMADGGHPVVSGTDLTDLSLDVAAITGLESGDVLRVTFAGDLMAVGSVKAVVPIAADALRVSLQAVQWLERAASLPSCTSVVFNGADGAPVTRAATPGPLDPEGDRRPQAAVDIAAQADDDVQAGAVVQVFGASGARWVMSAESAAVQADGGSPPPLLRVRGPAWQWHSAPPSVTAATAAERLRLTLLVRRGDQEPIRLAHCGLSSMHPRYWGRLPDDDELFAPLASAPLEALPLDVRRPVVPRFPLAGGSAAADAIELCVPLGDSPFPAFLPAYRATDPDAVRDGLRSFTPALFLDDRLSDAGVNALAARAEFIRYQSAPHPQPLNGIYAGFFVEEVSIVAIPDAIHREWRLHEATESGTASPPDVPDVPAPPCAPEWPFSDCHPCTLAAPVVTAALWADRIQLRWPADPTDVSRETMYTVEEAVLTGSSWSAWSIVATGRSNEVDLYGRPPGEYAYRVTAARDGLASPPSFFVSVLVPARHRAIVDRPGAPHHALLVLHRALMRMCAARGDCMAVLTLPEHYREDDTIAHARALASSHADDHALSYAAIYHPWLFISEDTRVVARPMPPDGAACGVLARRALERGAWVAPANEPLTGVVALAPPLAPERLLDLQRARINVVRQQPRGFMFLNEDTLSRDPDLRRINVRRLMILLRRRALQVGARYVFEPNDDGFRRLVQRAFESTLGDLHARGAFAGRTAASAFQVVTDATLNTPQARDAGRFFVELKVAPSLPLTFLRIRLVQRGERLQASEER